MSSKKEGGNYTYGQGYSDSSKEIQTVVYDAVVDNILTTYSNNPQKFEAELNKLFTDIPNPLGLNIEEYLERLAKIKNEQRLTRDQEFAKQYSQRIIPLI